MNTFLHFVVSLQSIFYTLGLIFVFDVNIYSYSLLRLFKIDPVVSLLLAAIRQYFILALSLPLRRAHTQRFQSADSGLDGCFQQKQSVIGSVGSSTSPDLPISYT